MVHLALFVVCLSMRFVAMLSLRMKRYDFIQYNSFRCAFLFFSFLICACILYIQIDDATAALTAMNTQLIEGQPIYVFESKGGTKPRTSASHSSGGARGVDNYRGGKNIIDILLLEVFNVVLLCFVIQTIYICCT